MNSPGIWLAKNGKAKKLGGNVERTVVWREQQKPNMGAAEYWHCLHSILHKKKYILIFIFIEYFVTSEGSHL
jgi:hypothetical protein